MSGKNGYVSSVPKPGGVADDDTLTSQLACRESTSRLSLRRPKDGTQDHFLQVAEREGERDFLVPRWSSPVSLFLPQTLVVQRLKYELVMALWSSGHSDWKTGPSRPNQKRLWMRTTCGHYNSSKAACSQCGLMRS